MSRKRRSRRTVHINQQTWLYVIGGSGIKFIRPNGKAVYVGYRKLFPGYDVGRDQWDRCFRVLPSQVKEYIEDNLI